MLPPDNPVLLYSLVAGSVKLHFNCPGYHSPTTAAAGLLFSSTATWVLTASFNHLQYHRLFRLCHRRTVILPLYHSRSSMHGCTRGISSSVAVRFWVSPTSWPSIPNVVTWFHPPWMVLGSLPSCFHFFALYGLYNIMGLFRETCPRLQCSPVNLPCLHLQSFLFFGAV